MLSERTHRYIYLFGLCALAFGMMMGTVPTSVPQLILLGNWLLEADFKRKWHQLKQNVLFWVLSSAFMFHFLGLAWTSDFGHGLDDVRTKIPLMFLPLIFFSNKELSRKEFEVVLLFFLAGSLTNTLWCLLYSFVLHDNEVIRNASRFMSHIRLGLFLNVAIVVCLWFSFQWKKTGLRILMLCMAFYFLIVLGVLGRASGLVNFIILVFLMLGYGILRLPMLYKLIALVALISSAVMVWIYLDNIRKEQLIVNNSPNNVQQKVTPWGTGYYHDDVDQKENGNYVRINIQLEELQRGWKRTFPEDSFSFEPRHNVERFDILVRYMASKGLNKDSVGLASLNREDLENIRRNVVNYKYPSWTYLHKRTYELVNEYNEFMSQGQVNGQSLTMRVYFWKAAWDIVKKNSIFGVGTGDVQEELNKTYASTNSPLTKEWYKRPHNQFLTITVALGFVGLLIFLVSVFYPAVFLRQNFLWIYWLFFITAVLSFITEDTLETQAGLTFFAFFQTLFVSQAWYAKIKTRQTPED
ncbi:MAG: O-antigen ligase family protein [Bacteroidia bacterium]|nr:O-antigen ligase family protein [Bacteroidia bacterium]